jgi:DNA-binding transcriptional LysR family regulator
MSLLSLVQEVNSVEAIKKAVEVKLGAAFMSRAVVEKEVKLGLLAVLHIEVRSRTMHPTTAKEVA